MTDEDDRHSIAHLNQALGAGTEYLWTASPNLRWDDRNGRHEEALLEPDRGHKCPTCLSRMTTAHLISAMLGVTYNEIAQRHETRRNIDGRYEIGR